MKGYLNATELADYLVQKDVPFRTAHDLVGRIVLHAISINLELHELNLIGQQVERGMPMGGKLYPSAHNVAADRSRPWRWQVRCATASRP